MTGHIALTSAMTLVLIPNMLIAVLLSRSCIASMDDYPRPNPAEDTSSYGKHFQRSMTLMTTSTQENRNTVRILYYGQSIVGQRWSEMVDADLRQRFPNTNFITGNLALDGFGSDRLVRTMHYDVFPFYPDLLVFHVYGSNVAFENIIKAVRERTTSEIIIQTDHAHTWPKPSAENLDEQKTGDRNRRFLPRIARDYNCALQPQRDEWVQYLLDNNMEPAELLTDNVHLNKHGKWLMAELLKRFLVYLPDEPQDEWKDMVKTYVAGKDVRWQDNTLTLEFKGNRVVALAAEGTGGTARVLIDGREPSEFPECYAFTRPRSIKNGDLGTNIGTNNWPAIMKITWQKPPILEEWTATFYDFTTGHEDFKFTVTGSVTGLDGSGTGKEKFISNSGRIVMESQDWTFRVDRMDSNRATPDDWTVSWKVIPMFTNDYTSPEVKDPASEYETVLAQGLRNTKHKLELVAGGQRPAIRAIRVYMPPYQ